jgi:hypothetical protein
MPRKETMVNPLNYLVEVVDDAAVSVLQSKVWFEW